MNSHTISVIYESRFTVKAQDLNQLVVLILNSSTCYDELDIYCICKTKLNTTLFCFISQYSQKMRSVTGNSRGIIGKHAHDQEVCTNTIDSIFLKKYPCKLQ